MSSPAPIPAPPRRRSFAGPVVLIVLGIVFLLGTMGVLHWYNLGSVYAQYWPVLIIIWGVIKLVEHQRAQQEGFRPSGIGVGGVFLLLFVITTGLIASQVRKVNWQGLHDEIGWDDNDLNDLFGGKTFNYHDQLTQALPSGASLHVVSDRGAIRILTSSDSQITVVVDKKVHADNQEDADKYNLQTKPQITVNDNILTLNANTQGAGEHGISTDLAVSLPAGAAVSISSKHGDVTISGRKAKLDVSAQHGDVALDDITGDANLYLQRSSAKISKIAGDLSVDGRANEITVSDVKGAVRLSGEFMESVRLSQIAKTVTFKSARTDLEFAKLDGSLDLDSGDLRASSVSGPARLSTRSKDIRLDGLSGDLRLDDSNGAVELVVHKLGNLQVDNKNGDIQLSLPAQASFRLDAKALNGEIESDFNELKVSNGDNQATASGSVGSANTIIRLNNEHGTIEIRKGSAQASAPAAPAAPHAPHLPSSDTSEEPTEN
ncbi:MAG TPA: DUF4097 family beta strand repeat-containing protein [Terriglobales bacterium]|nr:DUF4097 family beta strand repeat-containing protein [Terriglobales bacterium]